MLFADRRDAGRRLAHVLDRYRSERPVILALPRGGVPVAYEIAAALGAELDLLTVRKIGVPGHEELALGAVVEGSETTPVINLDVRATVGVTQAQIDAAVERLALEIAGRRQLYRKDSAPAELAGRTVIVVDDGIATGATMRAALRGLRQRDPALVVLAVPVAPASALRALAEECDEIVCLGTPEPFVAVGLHYAHFGQTSDDEVVHLLAQAARFKRVTTES